MRIGRQTLCKLGLILACTANALAQEKPPGFNPNSDTGRIAEGKKRSARTSVQLFLDENGNLFDGEGMNLGEAFDPNDVKGREVTIMAHPKANVQRVTKLLDALESKVMAITVTSNVPKLKSAKAVATPAKKSDEKTLVLYLKYLSVADAERIVKEIITDGKSVRIAADSRLNAMIVRSTETQLEEIRVLLQQIDKEPKQKNGAVTKWRNWYTVKGNEEIANQAKYGQPTAHNPIGNPYRRVKALYRELESQAEELAHEIRSGSNQNDKIRSDLKAAVAAAFDARMETQRNELMNAKERLAAVEAKLKERQSQRDSIVDKRVDQLLRSDFGANQQQRMKSLKRPPRATSNVKVETSLAEYDHQLAVLKREKTELALKDAQRLKKMNVISSSDLSRLEYEAKEAAILEKRAKAVVDAYRESQKNTSSLNPLRANAADPYRSRNSSGNPKPSKPPKPSPKKLSVTQPSAQPSVASLFADKKPSKRPINTARTMSEFEKAKDALQKGRFDDALKQFAEIVENEEDNPIAHAYHALALARLGADELAAEAMWKANAKAKNGPIVKLDAKDSQPKNLDKAIEAAIKYLEVQEE